MIAENNIEVLAGKICPYCSQPAEYVDSAVIYGKSYGMIYLCRPCDAYVGCHKKSDKALGRLANRTLRGAKKQAHFYFDKIWKDGLMERTEAYSWLSENMGVIRDLTHIGMFNEEQCAKVVELSRQFLKDKSIAI